VTTEQQQPHYSRVSTAALVVGLISLPSAFLPFGIPVAIIAMILGFAARRDAISNARPVKMANAAIVLGGIAVLIWVVIVVGFALFAWAIDASALTVTLPHQLTHDGLHPRSNLLERE
jgi:hypothetical protein